MIDWESDPELKKMRDEFVDSLQVRARDLMEYIKNPVANKFEIRVIAHNLAGSAETYGLPMLGDAGAALDDVMTSGATEVTDPRFARHVSILREMIEEASVIRKDPERFREDPRLKELISCAEALDAEARS